jgi:hypothetical protein
MSKESCLSGTNRCFLGRRIDTLVKTNVFWEGQVVFFPQLIATFLEDVNLPQSPLQERLSMIALTAVRNKNNKVY